MAGKKIRWRDEDVITFLECYKRLECLWNTDLLEYKDSYMREEAYKTLLNKLNIENLTVEDVKSKIKGIRTTFCKLLRLETAREEMPQNNVYWYGIADSFLRDVTLKKRFSTTTAKNLQKRGLTMSNETPGQTIKMTSSPATSTSTVINYLLTDMSNPSSTFITQQAPRNRATNMSTAASNDDEFDHFARLIAIQLRRLPELEALDLMKEMQVMVINKKRELLTETIYQPQNNRKRKISVTSEDSWNSDGNLGVKEIIDPFSEDSVFQIKQEEV